MIHCILYLGLFSNMRPVVDKTGAAPFDFVLDTLGNDALFPIVLIVRYDPKNIICWISCTLKLIFE